MAISWYNRYPVSGMTDVQIYSGMVSIQYRDTTFYFGGANFSYQHMDVARTCFTSVARKLLGGL